MTVSPDLAYNKSRLDLLVFEDSSFRSLINNIPNYYYGPNETTTFGAVLKVYASEMGRLDFAANYDMLAINPIYLNPADIKRRYEEVLQISKNYPTSTMYDKDYKDLILALIPAYRQGTTKSAIEAVISAYTTFPVNVTELYTLISTGLYDISDKNSINISIQTPSGNIADSLKIITTDLFGAINNIKPAHIGVNLEEVFVETPENLDNFITGIIDTMTIFIPFVELQPLENEFIVAPFELSEFESTLAGAGGGQGLLAPQLFRAWEISKDTLLGIDLD